MIDLECFYDDPTDKNYGDIKLTHNAPSFTDPQLQHQFDLLKAANGDFKHYPEAGVDSLSYLNDTEKTGYLRAVRKQFSADGMKVKTISFDENGNMKIDASYEKN